MELIWRSCYAVTLLLLIHANAGGAIYLCYHCIYTEANGEYIESEGSDVNCQSDPHLTISFPCEGQCVTVEYTYRFIVFGIASETTAIWRTCADTFMTFEPPQDIPSAGQCYSGDAFDAWFDEFNEGVSSSGGAGMGTSQIQFTEEDLHGSICTCTNDHCESAGGSNGGTRVVPSIFVFIVVMLNIAIVAQ
ncbi:uncharacterized protein [Amphiura filiformis]|uniref:uncharacterized protein n=1 Tax=Amphiura filiformis TaxID=82378 RepID=UPI003B216491